MSDWRWLGSILGSILRLERNRTSLAAAASLRRGECKRGCKMNKMSLFRRNVTKCHVRRKIESSAIIQIDFRLDSTSRTSLDKACLQGPRGQTFCTSQFLHHFLYVESKAKNCEVQNVWPLGPCKQALYKLVLDVELSRKSIWMIAEDSILRRT